ncbi:MAG: porin [Leptothrix sp. (in: b-proteobacteria)]
MKFTVQIIPAAVLAALACSGAQAQNVSFYGLIDTAVERVYNVGASGGVQTRMPSITGTLPSRLGFRGTEDLGAGLRATFTLEQGFAPNDGTMGQGGRIFGRQAHVGLAGSWGAVTLGRQYTMLFWSLLDTDVLGPSVYGLGSLDSYIPNARVDSSIAYRGTFSGLTVGATYSLGRDAVNAGPSPAGTNCPGQSSTDASACREWSALLKFDQPSWGAAFAADEFHGGTGAFAGLTSSAKTDRRVVLNGYYKTGDLKLAGGVINRKNDGSATTPKSQMLYVGATYQATPVLALDAEYARLKFSDSANKAALLALRGTYSLSKRTAVYAMVGQIGNDGTLALSVSSGAPGSNPVAGASQHAVAVGVRHSF